MGSTAQQDVNLPSDDPWTLGDRLAKARKAARPAPLNQTELGERLGFSKATIGRYEKNPHGVGDRYLGRTIRLWALATGWSAEWIEFGTGPAIPDGDPSEPNTASDLGEQPITCNEARHGLRVLEAA